MTPIRFANDVLKPWNELSLLLAKQVAIQPDVSDVSRLAGALVTAIRHIPEHLGMTKNETKLLLQENRAIQIVTDASDYYKHGTLNKKERNCTMSVASAFECNDLNEFKFLRNILSLKHVSYGECDFLYTTALAIKFWIERMGLDTDWSGQIMIADTTFKPEAGLYYDSSLCVQMSSVGLRTFKRQGDKLKPFACPDVRFVVYDER